MTTSIASPGEEESEKFIHREPEASSQDAEAGLSTDEVSQNLTEHVGDIDQDEVVEQCRCCCTAVGFCIRASFALGVFLIALFVFVIVVQSTWRTYQEGGRSFNIFLRAFSHFVPKIVSDGSCQQS